MSVTVVPAAARHAAAWARMRARLWPEASARVHRREIADYFSGGSRDPLATLIAEDAARRTLGFVELTIRSHAEGCSPGRIAYLEGWFVDAGARGTGVGRALLAAAEAWARRRRCSAFASDAWASNMQGRKAHLAVGFEEVGTIRCFRKELGASGAAPRAAATTAGRRSVRRAARR